MQVEIARHAGFCQGVRRAVQAAQQQAEQIASGTLARPVYTFGELIHNPQVVEALRAQGVVPVHSVEEARGRRVLIRSHGVEPEVIRDLEAAGCEVLDLTCPFVGRLHRIAAEAVAAGHTLILVGDRSHPEVKGTNGWAAGKAIILSSVEEAEALPEMEHALVCAQTTFRLDLWNDIVRVLRHRVRDLTERCTICSATEERQQAAGELAARADAMVVVGGRNSANTRKLYEVCAAQCPRTILVESAAEIPPAFANIHDFVGVAAGASTPDAALKEVVTAMTDIENTAPVTQETPVTQEPAQEAPAVQEAPAAENNDFMSQVEATFRKPRVGQAVTGTVVQLGDEEVIVNIGYKADGILKRADMMDQDVKEGDEIEVEVVKMSDAEGNVVLSQRNIVNRKAWEALMAKYEAGEYIEGVGKEAVKGGLLVDVGGVRAFVPASHLDRRYVEKIQDFVGKEMKLKIIEVDKAKKRIVASRKLFLNEEGAARKKEAWDRLEEGIVIHGIVRRLADFGAFVDVGGVDGLVHITDLSWGRVNHPSDVVKPGQEVDVKVVSLDRERERIQLSIKQLLPKPWDNAEERYPVGAVVEGKVVRITTFGAFVELEPGLDGLVHISQCALTKIAKVEDAVNVGDIVRVKILKVDTENKRISLSIRQVLEDEAYEAAEGSLDIEEGAEEAAEAVEKAVETAEEVAAVEEVAEAIEEASAPAEE